MTKGKRKQTIFVLFLIVLIVVGGNTLKLQNPDQQKSVDTSQINQLGDFDWDPPLTLPVGDTVLTLYVGDANNDGYNDIITGNDFNYTISIILWNASSQTWDPEIRKSASPRPLWVVVADANNDGYNDIVTAKYGSPGYVAMFLWNATSMDWDAETTVTVTNEPRSVFVGDANNDGYNDVVTCSGVDASVSIRPWNTTTEYWDSEIKCSVGSLPVGVFVADANNDEFNDIVVANYQDADVSILLWNTSLSTWDPQITKAVGPTPYRTFVADANNDGYNDIATPNLLDSSISILLWNSSLSTWDTEIRKSVGVRPNSIFIGDTNTDGWNDIAVPNEDDYNVSIFLWNTTTGTWDAEFTKFVGIDPMDIFVADTNNDGANDIAVCNSGSLFVEDDNVTILLGHRVPNNTQLFPITPNPDGDGIVQINWSDSSLATVYYIYRNISKIESVDGLVPIATVPESNYTDSNLPNGIYHYAIVAGNSFGNSSLSNCENVTVAIPPETPTLQPLTHIGYTINLNWSESPNTTAYYIYRDTSVILNVSFLNPIATSVTNYTQNIVPGEGTYYYVIVAGDSYANSTPSNCRNITLLTPVAISSGNSSYPLDASGTTNWTITDDGPGGFYRILKNGTLHKPWTSWESGKIIIIQVNTTSLGIWNYTIQYNDSAGFWGIPDTVLITIEAQTAPWDDDPSDATHAQGSSANITWTLFDNVGGGSYRVLRNNTPLNGWTLWSNNTPFDVNIDTSTLGIWNYTILYNNSVGLWATPDTVLITIEDQTAPWDSNPSDATYEQGAAANITWTLFDNVGGGFYQVLRNGTPLNGWTPWWHNIPFNIIINTSTLGTWNYTIQYNDSVGLWGTPDTVLITIVEPSNGDGGIPGFEIFFVILALVAAIILSKKKNKLTFNIGKKC